jgi:hypothetical protein
VHHLVDEAHLKRTLRAHVAPLENHRERVLKADEAR